MNSLKDFFWGIGKVSIVDVFLFLIVILYLFLSISNYNFLLVQTGESLPEDAVSDFFHIVESGDMSNVGFIEEYGDSFYELSADLRLENVFRWLFSLLIILLIPFLCLIKTSMFFNKEIILSNSILFSIISYLILFIFSLPLNLFSRVYEVIQVDLFGLVFGLLSLFIFVFSLSSLITYSLNIVVSEKKLSFKKMFLGYFKSLVSEFKFKSLDFISFISLTLFYLLFLSLVTPPQSIFLILVILFFFIVLLNLILYSYLTFRKLISY